MGPPEGSASPPIVSLRDFEQRRSLIVQDLFSAATDTGFFYLADHGIPAEVVETAFQKNEAFFSLPESVKRKYEGNRTNKAYILGWSKNKMSGELLPQVLKSCTYRPHQVLAPVQLGCCAMGC